LVDFTLSKALHASELTVPRLQGMSDRNLRKVRKLSLVGYYEYDQYGNLALIRDAKGRETALTHDEHRRRLTRTLPLGQTQ